MSSPALTIPDRRQHPRHVCQLTILMVTDSAARPIACETIDLSIGGARVQSWSQIPTGPCELSIGGSASEELWITGQVLETTIDVATGAITARISFDDARDGADQVLAALTDVEPAAGAPSPTRRPRRVVAGCGACLLALVAATAGAWYALRTPVDAAPIVTRHEAADSQVRVHLAKDPGDTAILSSAAPPTVVDDVRVHLGVNLPQEGTVLSVVTTVENRGSTTLTFPDGLTATVTARRGADVAATATLHNDILEVAPGELVSVDGAIDLGTTGDYDLDVVIEMTASEADSSTS